MMFFYITDILGKPCQYVDYLPFGEVMTEQSTNNIFDNIYKFNEFGGESDELLANKPNTVLN